MMYRHEWFKPEELMAYLKETSEESWCTEVVKTTDGKSCLLGHVFDWGHKIGGNKTANEAMDLFQEAFATTYMFYPVNDGKHPKYTQPTPKQRCIAYFENLMNGTELTTYEVMDACDNLKP